MLDLATEWPDWKKYIATHEHAERMAGPGIVSYTMELIPDNNIFQNSQVLALVLALVLRQSHGW